MRGSDREFSAFGQCVRRLRPSVRRSGRVLLASRFAVAFALLTGMLAASSVLAHADYDRSEPAAGETASQAPQQVQVWFTQDLFRREGKNGLEVYSFAGERVDLDDAAIDDDNRKLMTVSLQTDLADGDYTVRWYTLSADDGDAADGEFRFTVRAGGEADDTGQPAATATPAPTATPTATATPEDGAAEDGAAPEGERGADTSQRLPATEGWPCVGGSAPFLLLIGAFAVGHGRRRRR